MALVKKVSIEISVKEAMDLLAAPGTPKRVLNKIVAAIRAGNVTPRGALAAATAQVAKNKKESKKSLPEKTSALTV